MKKIDTFSHYREGESQMQRFLAELDPGNLELHDFDLFDWLLFASNFAKRVNYFNKDAHTTGAGELIPNGNWESFFLGANNYTIPRRESTEYKVIKKQITELISQFEQDGSLTPHLTLFVCFIKLMDFSKKAFNNLTARHLDFYYNEILQIQKQDATPDKAYVIFELAKKAFQERIPAGTSLDAKKDVSGKKLTFKTNEELIANQAKVVEIKSFLNDTYKGEFKVARVANSADGLGEKLPETANYWWPFGYNSSLGQLENAKLGFSIASSLLQLKEGERIITVKIDFTDLGKKLTDISQEEIAKNLTVLCSGEKEWLTGGILTCTKNTAESLILSIKLTKEFPSVVGYNQAVLLENFQTSDPVIRFMVDGVLNYELCAALSERMISSVEVSVAVTGIKSVQIENDNSTLNPEKPYFPFTAQPVTGSNFYIKYPEMFAKKWETADITINWKNAPESLVDHYNAYILNPKDPATVTKASFDAKANISIVDKDDFFKASTALLEKEEWKPKGVNFQLFLKNNEPGPNYKTIFSINNASHNSGTSEAIRLTLQQSALQDIYPKLYTLALTSTQTNPSRLIPNEPYIPLAEDIELNYTASEKALLSDIIRPKKLLIKDVSLLNQMTIGKNVLSLKSDLSENFVRSRSVLSALTSDLTNVVHTDTTADVQSTSPPSLQLFHEDVFGQYETEKAIGERSLLPEHLSKGEMFIGMDATPGTTVSLLIKALEGSENPLAITFGDNEKIKWSYLSGNKWVSLANYIIVNETKNFLESGILKFKVPEDLDTNHTRFTDKLVWIKAESEKSYDAVCKLQGIYAQAILATFEDHGNDLSHLNDGLPAESITKLISRIPQVKSLAQPYNSFDGKYRETNTEFYRRVSERLRHKNRAIARWDYEHLILQEFPSVFKVKCLNHTSAESYQSPGNVTLVVVPSTKNKNAFDIYQPRVSRATLNRISEYINGLNTMHVTAQVINPEYREAEIVADVRFGKQYDEVFYLKQLDEDIKKYISPWAFADSKEVVFDVTLNTNLLVNYLEQLYYVDYIDNLKIKVNGVLQTQYLIEVDPKSILVSAKRHTLSIATGVCL